MTSVGEILRSARESQGRTLAEIAEELCITQRYLRALEQNDLKSLPGTFFYRSFVRQYAALLGVPDKLIQPGLNALTVPEPEPPSMGQTPAKSVRTSPAPVRELDPLVQASNNYYFSDRRIGVSVGALAAVVLACSGFYAWWNRPPKLISSAPQRAAPAPREIAVQPIEKISVTEASATTSVDDMSHVVLNLSATEATWIKITSDGKQIFSGMLLPSQTKTLSGLDVAKMKVGNAGGLDVRLNGKPIGPLGASGQVREILFTSPGNFQILEHETPAVPATTL